MTRKVREQASLFVLKSTRFVRNLSFFSLYARRGGENVRMARLWKNMDYDI